MKNELNLNVLIVSVVLSSLIFGCRNNAGEITSPNKATNSTANSQIDLLADGEKNSINKELNFSKTVELVAIAEVAELSAIGPIKDLLRVNNIEADCAGSRAKQIFVSQENVRKASEIRGCPKVC